VTASRAIVLTIGDELLLGRTVDTNATWLADRLAVLGLPVARMETLADDAGTIAEAIDAATAEAALVVTTGGWARPRTTERSPASERRSAKGRERSRTLEVSSPGCGIPR
jgi:hypothetical protein